MYALKEVGRRLASPTEQDMRALKHLLRYIRGTLDVVLTHRLDPSADAEVLEVQSDSDWGACRETRRSTSCGVIRWCGVVLSTYSRTQNVVTTSSAESEYLGGCAAVADGLFIRELLKFAGFSTTVELHLDASSAISIASRRGLGKVRHLDIKHLWLQQMVATKKVRLKKAHGLHHAPDAGT
eukprot:3781062-Amphidinium_carterae.1